MTARSYTCDVCKTSGLAAPAPITIQIKRPGYLLLLQVCGAPCLVQRLTADRLAMIVSAYDTQATSW